MTLDADIGVRRGAFELDVSFSAADGEVVADGPAPTVLSGSPAFAPQVAKILHPLRLLTVEAALESAGAAS